MKIIQVDAKEATEKIKATFEELGKKPNVNKFIARAINNTTAKTNTYAKRVVADKYNIRPTEVSKGLVVIKTNEYVLKGTFKATPYTLAISKFNPKQMTGRRITEKRRKTISGIVVEIIKGKSQEIKSAFVSLASKSVVARGEYADNFKFSPKGKIKTLKTISILAAVNDEDNLDKIKDFSEKEFLIQLHSELNKKVYSIGRKR